MGQKPRGQFCRRAELVRWTGWSEEYIATLLEDGDLVTMPRRKPTSRRRYCVESVQELIDELKRKRRASSAEA
jgi:hypothetical protein